MAERAQGPTSRDSLLGGRVTILQPRRGYRAAIDPVLLAAAVPAVAGDHVLDVGSGTGAAALALAARVSGVRVTGLEKDPDLADLAAMSAGESGLSDRVDFVTGDLLRPPESLAPDGFDHGGFDHVMLNPPHQAAATGNPPPDAAKRRATVEGPAALADWLRFALAMVRRGGTVTVVHRFDRAPEVIAGLERGAGRVVVFPLWPKQQGQDAKRVIVQATKGAADAPRTAEGLVLHRPDGGYTAEAEAVLRGARALAL